MKRTCVGAALLAVSTFAPPAADAMPLAEYDRLSGGDQARYIVLLLNSTIGYLYAQDRGEHAVKLALFFNGDEDIALVEIDKGLETARWRSRETGVAHDVEHGVALMLDDIDIPVSRDVLVTLVRDFTPTGATGS